MNLLRGSRHEVGRITVHILWIMYTLIQLSVDSRNDFVGPSLDFQSMIAALQIVDLRKKQHIRHHEKMF